MKIKHSLPKNAMMIFEGYGIIVRPMNSYQLRLHNEEERYGHFFDWYYTTGTLVENFKGNNSSVSKKYLDAEELAMFINSRNRGTVIHIERPKQQMAEISQETLELLKSKGYDKAMPWLAKSFEK